VEVAPRTVRRGDIKPHARQRTDAGFLRVPVALGDGLEGRQFARDAEVAGTGLRTGLDERFVHLDGRARAVQHGVDAVEVLAGAGRLEGVTLAVQSSTEVPGPDLVPARGDGLDIAVDRPLRYQFPGVALRAVYSRVVSDGSSIE